MPGPAHGSVATTPAPPRNVHGAGSAVDLRHRHVPPRRPFAYAEKYNDFYVGDTILLGNLTLQGGLRWDQQQSTNTGVSIAREPDPGHAAHSSLLPPSRLMHGRHSDCALPAVTFAGDPER